MPNQLPDDDIHRYFLFDPSWAIFFIVVFFILTLAFLYQCERAKPRPQRWLHCLTLMAAMEFGGYIARVVLYAQPGGNPFKAELIILILAPNLLALCCYVVLGKLITYAFHTRRPDDRSYSNWVIRHPAWIPRFYVLSDLLCITIQAIGGALLSSATTQSQDDTAKAIEVAGLALQLFFIATFVIICLYVWLQVRRHSPSLLPEVTPSYLALAALIVMLVLRNSYRTAEFASGTFTTGYFQQNEAWYLVFDPTLMSVALMVALAFDFTKRMPAEALNPPTSTHTAPAEKDDVEMGIKSPSAEKVRHLQVASSTANSEDGDS